LNVIINPGLYERKRITIRERYLLIKGVLQNQSNVVSVKASLPGNPDKKVAHPILTARNRRIRTDGASKAENATNALRKAFQVSLP
jgi:hypothetical protein